MHRTLLRVLRASLPVLAAAGCSAGPHSMVPPDRVTRPEDLSYAPTDPPSSLARPFYEYRDVGVIVVAVAADTTMDSGDADEAADQGSTSDLSGRGPIEVQMRLVAKAAQRGPVVVLVANPDIEEEIAQHCKRFEGLCAALEGPNVKFVLVAHDGPWIRDFGPMFGWSSTEKAVVLDSRYYDMRLRQTVEYKRHRINQQRSVILAFENHLLEHGDHDDDTTFARREKLEAVYESLTRQNEILRDDGGYYRELDDLAPYPIAEALFMPETFGLYRPPLFLDGGNLIEMDNGRCLTTTDLISANGGREDLVRNALGSYYGCRSVTFLQPLPGPVIKHIDMFLMPVDGNRVLLASFLPEDTDPTNIGERDTYFEALQAGGRELMLRAAMAMRDNERTLKQAGLTVIRVPGLLPRVDDGDIYYPTNLNGLTRVYAEGKRQVFVPTYAGFAPKRQDAALRIIRNAFGPSSEVIPIEATDAAKLQGAVHCLSIVVPSKLTYLADSSHDKLRSAIEAKLRERARAVVNDQTFSLPGTWAVQQSKAFPPGTKVLFKENELQILLDGDTEILHVFLDRPRAQGRDWKISYRDKPEAETSGTVTLKWISSHRMRLVYGDDDDDVMDLERMTGD